MIDSDPRTAEPGGQKQRNISAGLQREHSPPERAGLPACRSLPARGRAGERTAPSAASAAGRGGARGRPRMDLKPRGRRG